MNFRIENIDEIIVFTITDSVIEGSGAIELKAKMLVLAQPDIKALVIDFSSVDIIDSAGLGALLLAHRQLREGNIPIYLVNVNKHIMNLFYITHIDTLFNYTNSVDVCLSQVKEISKTAK